LTTWLRDFFGLSFRDEQARLEKEIQTIIDEGEESGLIDEHSGQMIQSILEFRETIVREVMIPRTEIVAIRSDCPIEEITKTIAEHGHTRIPVYQESIDNIIGILNVKDLLKYWSRLITEEELVSVLQKPYYIPETKNIHLLLSELRYRKYHMAIVIDEYGGTSGLVTLEDLLEEIVGEIHDEHDTAEQEIMPLPDGSVLIDSRIEIEKVEEYFNIKIPEGKFETLAGFILFLIKRIPAAGETIPYENLEITIDSADERSIKKVKIRKKVQEAAPAVQ